ncbi:MAG: DUF4091 domain-containing protein [Clostridia bacterium]|nr:DUF4091 domain-containing protein [Clostridia bacterium]
MRYIAVDSAEYTYPDSLNYESAGNSIEVDAPRGGYANFQILLDGLKEDFRKENWIPESVYTDPELAKQAQIGFPRASGISVKTDIGFETEWFSMVPVTVEKNHGLAEENFKPHFPERVAPYRIYDCLRPFDGTLDVGVGDGRCPDTGIAGLFGSVAIPKDAAYGEYSSFVEITVGDETVKIPLNVKVYKAVVPEESLKIIQGYNAGAVAMYHGVDPKTEEFRRLDAEYIGALRRMRQNMMYTGGVKVTEIEKNKYEFDFSVMEETMRRQMAQGIRFFNGPSVGWRKSWSESTILVRGSIPSMSYEGYCYLSQYLPALRDMLVKNGWLDCFVMGIADEPNEFNSTEFRALCGLVHRIVPEIRLIDAMSYGDLHGALDIWVPLNAEYDKHRTEIETLRDNGAEIWHYVCCAPRGEEYINRFMDYPLLATRYLFWGNYKYDLTGYLHWASNCYQPGQDPFRLNCPEHRNVDAVCYLPSGDTHLLYPGENGPWLSVRAEAQRESAEEYEMLKRLSETDKAKADEICAKVFRNFRDVEYGISEFRSVRRELLEALSEIEE